MSQPALRTLHDLAGENSEMRHLLVVLLLLAFAVPPGAAGAAAGRAEQAPSQRSAAPRPDATEWRATLDKTLQLAIGGKDEEVIAIYEGYVAKYPQFAEAHGMLGGAHEALARRPGTPPAVRSAQLETAAKHMERAFALWGDEGAWVPIRSLVDVYGPPPFGLDRPDRRRAVVAEAARRFPAEPQTHVERARLLIEDGTTNELEAALRAARAAVPNVPAPRAELADGLWALAPGAPMDAAMLLATESLALLDEAVKAHPDSLRALEAKARLCRDQALLSPPDRAKQLTADADRIDKRVAELMEQRSRR
jgi:tetratricopeptide (TPR) repeat protein